MASDPLPRFFSGIGLPIFCESAIIMLMKFLPTKIILDVVLAILISFAAYYFSTDARLSIIPNPRYGDVDSKMIGTENYREANLSIVNLTPLIPAYSVNADVDFIGVFQKKSNPKEIHACWLNYSPPLKKPSLKNVFLFNSFSNFLIDYRDWADAMSAIQDREPDFTTGFYMKVNLDYRKWPVKEVKSFRKIYTLQEFGERLIQDVENTLMRPDRLRDPEATRFKHLGMKQLIEMIDSVQHSEDDYACLCIVYDMPSCSMLR